MKNNLEYKPFSGLQVFCQKCKNVISTKSKKSKSECNHPIDRQIYKAVIIVPNSGCKRKTKNLKAKEFNDAIIELIQFKKEVEHPELFAEEKEEKPDTLLDAIAMYLDYLQDIDVPHHKKKYLSKKYINSITIELKDFIIFLKQDITKDIKNFKIADINDNIVGKYCEYIDAKNQSYSTFTHRIKTLRGFYSFLLTQKHYEATNLWKEVKLKTQNAKNISIDKEDFFNLLNEITPNDSKIKVGKSTKTMYRPWLKDFIKLKAYTGQRNTEVAELKWNMINFVDGKPIYIKSPNRKINQQKNNIKPEELEFVFIPIGEELQETLNNLNLKDNINSNEYIVAPNFGDRYNLGKQASKSFTFYWKKLNKPYNRNLTDLRKTYATQENMYHNSPISTLHADIETTKKHYVDDSKIVRKMVKNGFKVFP